METLQTIVIKQEYHDTNLPKTSAGGANAMSVPIRASPQQREALDEFFAGGIYRQREEVEELAARIDLPSLWIYSWMTRQRVSKGLQRSRRPNNWKGIAGDVMTMEDDPPAVARPPKKRRIRGPKPSAAGDPSASSSTSIPPTSTRLTIRLPARQVPSSDTHSEDSALESLSVAQPENGDDASSHRTTHTENAGMENLTLPSSVSDAHIQDEKAPHVRNRFSQDKTSESNPHAGAFLLYQQLRGSLVAGTDVEEALARIGGLPKTRTTASVPAPNPSVVPRRPSPTPKPVRAGKPQRAIPEHKASSSSTSDRFTAPRRKGAEPTPPPVSLEPMEDWSVNMNVREEDMACIEGVLELDSVEAPQSSRTPDLIHVLDPHGQAEVPPSPSPSPPAEGPPVYQGTHTFMFDPGVPPRTEESFDSLPRVVKAAPPTAGSLLQLLKSRNHSLHLDMPMEPPDDSVLQHSLDGQPPSATDGNLFRLVPATWDL